MWRALILLALVAGCGDAQTAADPGPNFWPDASADARGARDTPEPDLAADTPAQDIPEAEDAADTPAPLDVPADADPDTGSDAPEDTGSDAPEDTGSDAPEDTAPDAPEDAEPDTPPFAPAPSGCISEVGVGHHVFTCEANIRFDLEVPPACMEAPCGVIFDVHGLSMDADQQDRNTRMRALGAEHGYLVVQPNAPNRAWSGPAHDAGVWAFMQDVVAAYQADADRLHFMGFSQGGDLTLRMLCAHADELASVAPAATNGLDCPELPAAEVAIFHMHGTGDVLYGFNLAEGLRDRMIEHWGFANPEPVADAPNHRATRWTTPAGTPYEFHAHDFRADSGLLGGHCFPGSPDHDVTLPGQLFAYGCLGDGQFDYARLAVEFFQDNPRQ